jgi:hypothetical protein
MKGSRTRTDEICQIGSFLLGVRGRQIETRLATLLKLSRGHRSLITSVQLVIHIAPIFLIRWIHFVFRACIGRVRGCRFLILGILSWLYPSVSHRRLETVAGFIDKSIP